MYRFRQPFGVHVLGGLLASVTLPSTATPTITASAPRIGPTHDVGELPALGWHSWYAYDPNLRLNETLVLETANQFISLGLANAGYEYIVIADGYWSLPARNIYTGRLIPDPSKFPNGIGSLADQVHGVGLKLGIVACAGNTCIDGTPGSLGNEVLDAATFAEWGIDYLQYNPGHNIPANWTDSPKPPGGDWYNSNTAIRYRQMTAALNKTGRPFLFDINVGGSQSRVWEWGGRVAHSWLISDKPTPSWSVITGSIASNVKYLDSVDFYSHNEIDLLQLGNGDLTIQEQRTYFAAWAFLKSPLLLGTDVALLNTAQLAIIKNAELLEFNQDPIVGTPAKPFAPFMGAPTTSPPEFYAGQSSKGTHVFIINTNTTATKTFEFAKVPGLGRRGSGTQFVVHDMWTGEDLGTFKTSYSTTVDMHDTAAFLITAAACENCVSDFGGEKVVHCSKGV